MKTMNLPLVGTLLLFGAILMAIFTSCEPKVVDNDVGVDSTKEASIELPSQSTHMVTDVETYHDVFEMMEMMNIPYFRTFVAVSVYESGWNYESSLASICHNIFGFKCQSWYDCSSCDPHFNHSRFESKLEAINFLAAWIQRDPPRQKETAFDYLKRRRYNTVNPDYYTTLGVVKSQMMDRILSARI